MPVELPAKVCVEETAVPLTCMVKSDEPKVPPLLLTTVLMTRSLGGFVLVYVQVTPSPSARLMETDVPLVPIMVLPRPLASTEQTTELNTHSAGMVSLTL